MCRNIFITSWYNFLFANTRIKLNSNVVYRSLIYTLGLQIVHTGMRLLTSCPWSTMCACVTDEQLLRFVKARRTRLLGSNSVSNARIMSLRCCWKRLLTFTIQLHLPEIFIALNALEPCVIQHVVFVTRAFPCQEITLLTVSLRIRSRYALTRWVTAAIC